MANIHLVSADIAYSLSGWLLAHPLGALENVG